MNDLATFTIDALLQEKPDEMPYYFSLLNEVCMKFETIWSTQAYFDHFKEMTLDPLWFASAIASNSAKEAEGARRIWEMASRVQDPVLYDLLRQHAVDESRHARFYIAMIKFVFPWCESDLKEQLAEKLPAYTLDDHPQKNKPSSDNYLLDELIQMNIGEIRTRVHQFMIAPILRAYCEEQHIEKINTIMKNLISDETRHVHYTAEWIESACKQGKHEDVRKILHRRWKQFNDITQAEMATAEFSI
jgi:uncharacterized membrane-anchored protein YjiN (DUF445 family)